MTLSYEKKIKIASILSDIPMSKLAEYLEIKPPALTTKIKNGIFRYNEIESIAEFFGCEYRAYMFFADGYIATGDSFKAIILDACEHAGISQSVMAKEFGISRQGVSDKLSNGTFKIEELEKYASNIGCKFYAYFKYKDLVF